MLFRSADAQCSSFQRRDSLRFESFFFPSRRRCTLPQVGLVAAACGLLAWPQPDRVQPPWKPDNFAAWRDVCDWVSREVPPEALCLTPKYNVGFKWWAQRAEFVTWKDCPQDAANLLEWKDRLRLVADWRDKYFARGFGNEALFDLRQYGAIDYVIAWNADPIQIGRAHV